MTYVVTEACVRCKYTDCVDVCPVDCFREGANFLVIDPDECIDCTLCVAECPVEAIYAEDDVPDDQQQFIALNAELSKQWKPIVERKDPLPDADEWAKVNVVVRRRDDGSMQVRTVARPEPPAELARIARSDIDALDREVATERGAASGAGSPARG